MKMLIGLLAVLPLCLVSLSAAAQQWDTHTSSDEMTGEKRAFATSPSVSPNRSLGFPYQDVEAWLGFGCKRHNEWIYVGFSTAPNLINDTPHSGGYSTFSTRVRWDDKVERVSMEQKWGAQFLHFEDDAVTIARMMAAKELLLELQWYGASEAYFRFSLRGAAEAITRARAICRAKAMDENVDVRTIQRLLRQAGFDPGAIDGRWGPATANALSRFQAAQGRPASGKADQETLRLLGYPTPQGVPAAESLANTQPAAPGSDNADRMTSILRNVEKLKSNGGQQQGALPSQNQAIAPGPSDPQRQQIQSALQTQIQRCWHLDPAPPTSEDMNVVVHINLAPDGRLIGTPRVADTARMNGDAYFRSTAENAVRAILKCSPFKLPAAQYTDWKQVTLTFNTKGLFGS